MLTHGFWIDGIHALGLVKYLQPDCLDEDDDQEGDDNTRYDAPKCARQSLSPGKPF